MGAPQFYTTMMEPTIEATSIMLWIAANHPSNGKPKFRLVWSNDQTELRIGTVSYYVGNVKVSEGEQVGTFPKYSWIANRWILEVWCGPDISYTPELPESSQGTYEPLYVFEDGDGNALPLNLMVVKIVIHRYLQPASTPGEIATRLKAAIDLKDAKALAYTEDAIDTSAMQSLLHWKEADQVPSNYWVDSPNTRK